MSNYDNIYLFFYPFILTGFFLFVVDFLNKTLILESLHEFNKKYGFHPYAQGTYSDSEIDTESEPELKSSDNQEEQEQEEEKEEVGEVEEEETQKVKQMTLEEYEFEKFKLTDKYKFLTKYKLEKKDEELCCKEKNSNNLVYEYIPQLEEIIVLNYDFDNDYYRYWCDKSVPYYLLNVVAIKYVNTYNRSHLFICEKEEVVEDSNEIFINTLNTEQKLENRYTKNHFKYKGKLSELTFFQDNSKSKKNIDFNSFNELFNKENIR